MPSHLGRAGKRRFRSQRFISPRFARLIGVCTALVVTTAVVTAATANARPVAHMQPPLKINACPALYALGVQGTGESSADAAPTTDTGMLSTIFQPMLAEAGKPGVADRAYVPYQASFGGVMQAGPAPYAQSVEGGLSSLRDMAKGIADRCEKTRFAVAGYSQGAHVASMFAQEVGQGHGVIPADRIAGVALLGDPTRTPGAPLFPGSPGKASPDPAPGTKGSAVAGVQALAQPPAAGGGIGPDRDIAKNFGALTGRVATFCLAGDLACDAPSGAPILRVVSNIVGQSDLSGGDPIAALGSVAQALAFTAIKTATNVVNKDIQGTSLDTLSIEPEKSLSQRIADASDPRTPLDVPGALKAVLKVGMIGLNSVLTFAKAVLTPENIGELATVGLTDPLAGLLLLGQKMLGAIPELISPTTGIQLVQQSFKSVVENITDNSELLNTATWVKYWDVVQRHGAYRSTSMTANGAAPVKFVADWFAALAKDVAAQFGSGAHPARGVGGSDVVPFSPGSGAADTQRSGSAGQFPFQTNQGSGTNAVVPGGAPTSAGAPPAGQYPF